MLPEYLPTPVLYYKLKDEDTALERFMDSQSFGVRFLFTAVDVIIKYYWESFFKVLPHWNHI